MGKNERPTPDNLYRASIDVPLGLFYSSESFLARSTLSRIVSNITNSIVVSEMSNADISEREKEIEEDIFEMAEDMGNFLPKPDTSKNSRKSIRMMHTT